MKEYKIMIKEVLARVVTVKADGAANAVGTVKEMHKNEEIVLDADDFSRVDFTITG
jgi:hypothetical protein